uniref:Uncharacterized protein n=1 Tax=Rhizophora mucronata TaxID=61149 RepID=A0A2P2M827_RHIMU
MSIFPSSLYWSLYKSNIPHFVHFAYPANLKAHYCQTYPFH